MASPFDLRSLGITAPEILRNPPPALLYELAVEHERAAILANGALATFSGARTGRSPKDKRIVRGPLSEAHVWWGPVNIPIESDAFLACKRRALESLQGHDRVFVVDAFAGWSAEDRIKVRVVCGRAYHALFMHNLLIRPTGDELARFGEPDLLILNAGDADADPATPGLGSKTGVLLDLDRREMVILGTSYAGEMKKGVFTFMNHAMPLRGVLSMHCSANEGASGDVTLFFGLSGTGKTTLSSDPRRHLIGDDEHCWTDDGVFNIEGGCYAKCIDLDEEHEPQIYHAIRFGSVLENVVFDPATRVPDYGDSSLTENTRACYPIDSIENAKVPCAAGHPSNIVFLTCDAFGVLPPVSKLSPEQAMYYYLSGYTAKTAGTEVGTREPEATFSACFGAAFLVWPPTKYAELLADRIRRHKADAWLVNTGWSGGPYGVGSRMKLNHTRAIIDAIHSGELARSPTIEDPIFGLTIPTSCPHVPDDMLIPRRTWQNAEAYERAARVLVGRFRDNFARFADHTSEAVKQAGPR
jgi:phosphoenolpyruvate carboxykinase (ATP)